MMASVITTAPDALRVDAAFLREGDLGGLIWDSADRFDHPLLAYDTDRDYAHTTLRFRWRSSGVVALDAVNGPTVTIEGRDEAGTPRAWYVRLWNYAAGAPSDAIVTLPFSDLAGGFMHPAEADPVWPGDIDRMFVSMVAPGFVPGSEEPLPTPAEGWIELSEIACEGDRPMLLIGDVVLPPTGLCAATGYDDDGTQTPARLVRNLRGLGYRGSVVNYVGMSHFFRLAAEGDGFVLDTSGDPLCAPARAWHRAGSPNWRQPAIRRSPRCPTRCSPSIAPRRGSSAPGPAIRREPAGTRPPPCSRPPMPRRWPGCDRSRRNSPD
jgi:hypothetical protein